MLDLQFIRQHHAEVASNCRNRGIDVNVDKILELDTQRRALIHRIESMRHHQKELQQSVRSARDEERQSLIDEGRQLKEEVQTSEQEHREVDERLHREWSRIPNLTHPDAPVGKEETDNLELRTWGQPRTFDFPPKDHLELGQSLDLVDFDAGSRVTGSGFYFLKNDAVLLEQALIQYALRLLIKKGFTVTITPDLARDEILDGIGFSPRGDETQIYSIKDTHLSLIATAEITLGGMFRNKILDESDLPILLAGLSHCFRTEAGAHGRATRGLYRVHQFSKLEMFIFTTPEQSNAMLETLVSIEEELFQGLEIPYRVVDTCTGDLGGPAYRKYDLEAWMPGREGTPHEKNATSGQSKGNWGEITSCSNCTDYQSRRLAIRFRSKGKKGTQFVHTLNGTAIALSRTLIALLENYQQSDGTVLIPPVLVPWMGKERIENTRLP